MSFLRKLARARKRAAPVPGPGIFYQRARALLETYEIPLQALVKEARAARAGQLVAVLAVGKPPTQLQCEAVLVRTHLGGTLLVAPSESMLGLMRAHDLPDGVARISRPVPGRTHAVVIAADGMFCGTLAEVG
jgi:hypothetical protein